MANFFIGIVAEMTGHCFNHDDKDSVASSATVNFVQQQQNMTSYVHWSVMVLPML